MYHEKTIKELQQTFPEIKQTGISRKGNQIWEFDGMIEAGVHLSGELFGEECIVWAVIDPDNGKILDIRYPLSEN